MAILIKILKSSALHSLFLFSLLCSLSCSSSSDHPYLYEDRVLVERDTQDISKVVWDFSTVLKYEKGLHLDDALVCSGEDRSKIRLQFSTQDILELCEARILLVDVAEGLLERINKSQAAFKLHPYPLTADQLEIYIDFQSYYGKYVDPYYIGWVVLEEGTSYFYAFTVKEHRFDFWHSRSEPYFKSLSFANLQRDAENKYRQAHPDVHSQPFGESRVLQEESKLRRRGT